MRSFVAAFAALLLTGITAQADNLVQFVRNNTLSATHTKQRLQTIYGKSAPTATSPALDLYKVNYRSLNAKGVSVVLSGLVVLPQGGAPKGLVVFNHGTTADRHASPSRYRGGYVEGRYPSETELAALTFASGGYAVAMPDYLGLGDDKGAHPYPLSAVNSRSAIDIISPARTIASRQKVAVGPRLYITGYSEGGAIAMWTVRNLENKPGAAYRVTAAVPMSGPYDLSGATRTSILAPVANLQDIVLRLYFLGYTLDYFQRERGIKLTDYFQPRMASAIASAFGQSKSDEAIFQQLAVAAFLTGATQSIERVITPRFKKALQTFDLSDPVIREMPKNDCYDWSPKIPMLLTYLPNDSIVASDYSKQAIKTMRARGVGTNLVREYAIPNKRLNHVTGIPWSILTARRFFDRKFAAFPVSLANAKP